MKDTITNIIKNTLDICKNKGLLTIEEIPPIIIERPKREEFGDFSTNAAMLIASKEGEPPRKIAEIITREIRDEGKIIKKVDIAGPGFINIFVEKGQWLKSLKDIAVIGNRYGQTNIGKGKKVQIEFVSANPTGPLHIGHARGAAVGDALANILESVGYDVFKEFYINDRGRQIETLGRSCYIRYKQLLGEKASMPEDFYRGEYIKDIARDLVSKYGSKYSGDRFKICPQTPEPVQEIARFAKSILLNHIRKDLEDFGVTFNNWFSESGLYEKGFVDKTIDELRKKRVVFEQDGAAWFKTTDFDDDKDRVLEKADGEKTYFASDAAYHLDKINRKFDTIINIWGADHHGYEARIRAVFKAMGYDDKEMLKIIFVQLVSLLRNGVNVPMGKREGDFVTLRQVLDEVGRDACRFFFLMRKSDAHLEFDLELAKKQAPENPVFYVQYAYARICSIIKHAKENNVECPCSEDVDLSLLNQDEELTIIKTLVSFPDVLETCAVSLEPHKLTFYLQELAGIFHPYYNKNRVVSPDNIPLSKSRLFLCNAVKTVIKNGLSILKVSAPDVM
ncbi:MAG: arginine--tRNA ligase [Deltaproteobacteria bacterium]|nr:arginine--tRNA ligase [Deltaproteobacteria bacterium]